MKRVTALFVVLMLWVGQAYAGHPLITDDSGTQGRGKFQLELNAEYSSDKETVDGIGVEERSWEASSTVSFGVTDNADLVVGVPYKWVTAKEGGIETSDEDGISDVSVEFKWRFYEKNGLGLAIKPGITLPTGDEDRGFGNGRASYSVFVITSKEAGRWAFHVNGGYMRNVYAIAEDEAANRSDLWHLSLATELSATDFLTIVANVGVETNTDRGSDTHPAFVLGGVIYSVTENVSIDFGVKAGLNSAETDVALLAGVAMVF